MSLIRFLIFLSLGTILSWTALALVIINLDPFSNPVVGPTLFYSSGWLAVTGTVAIAGFYVRHWFERQGVPFVQIAMAVRQAVLLSSGLVAALIMQHARLLNAWTLILVVLLVGGAELFFLAGQSRRSTSPPPATL